MSDNITAEGLCLAMDAFRSEDDWAERDRGVYDQKVMEREIKELLPVEVGVRAILELRDKQEK